MQTDITRAEQIEATLHQFLQRTPEALSAIAASRQGFSVAVARRTGLSERAEDALAVAAARILDMAHEVNNQLNQGDIGRILIEGTERTTIVSGAGRDLILIVAMPADAKLGLAMLSIRTTANAIAAIYR